MILNILAETSFFGFGIGVLVVGILALIGLGVFVLLTLYRKVEKGTALIRTGFGGTKVIFNGGYVFPIVHRADLMDISLKRVELDRSEKNGLICKDNIRADIKVAFFVRVNNAEEDVLRVAESIGCERASSESEIRALFDAKFSEALKTVGKRFDFTSLYEDRDTFRDEILKVIGTDLNGFILDDAAIDHLEQTSLALMDPQNILDAEGIKKITELTADQNQLANSIRREEEKVIKQQNVEAREAILELERQLAETEAKQKREVETVQFREEAEAQKVKEEEMQKSERARIEAEEEIQIAEENKQRQVLVAQRNKERTDAVELERVERERKLEEIERQRITMIKEIEAEKAVEQQKKEIQDVIRERVAVEKTVVEEEQNIKDTEALAAKSAASKLAEERIILAEAEESASEKEANAKKLLAEAVAKEAAAVGLGEADVMRAKGAADAEAIEQKAAAMKLFEEAGQEHEEFKLELDKEKEIELAEIDVQRQVAEQQAIVVGEALKSANIDIVGGETQFFDRITNAITTGKVVDRTVENSQVLDDVKETFFNGDPEYFKSQLATWVDQFGMSSDDLKNLSVAGVLGKVIASGSQSDREKAVGFLGQADRFGIAELKPEQLLKKLG